MRKVVLTTLAGVLGLAVLLVGAQALTAGHGKSRIKADTLNSYQEVGGAASAGLSMPGTGEFKATIDDDDQTIEWELTYAGLSGAPTQAHIHFGNRYLAGGVSVFFCGTAVATPPATQWPACPAAPAGVTQPVTLTGTWRPNDVIGPSGQGIAAGEWDEFVAALRAGMAYANIHTAMFAGGEIRAQINNKDGKQPG
jgi:hypothetical protein